MSNQEPKTLPTLRDRLKNSDRVILTRGLSLQPDPEQERVRYIAGEYTASDLPAIAYEQGFVIQVTSEQLLAIALPKVAKEKELEQRQKAESKRQKDQS
jgi:hypothetical protein